MNGKRPAPQDGESQNSPKVNKINIAEQIAQAKERAAQLAAKRAGQTASESTAKPATPEPAAPSQISQTSGSEAARSRIEAMKARINAATRTGQPTQKSDEPSRQPATSTFGREDVVNEGRGGLGTALHPLLMSDSKPSDAVSKGKQPAGGFGSKTKAKQAKQGPVDAEAQYNPYIDASTTQAASGRGRQQRQMKFPEQGKHLREAANARKLEQMEELKARIAASTRRAVLEEDRTEAALVVQPPPSVEWWDEALILGDSPDKTYPDFDNAVNPFLKLDITGDDSPITLYIQHPVLIEPPSAKNMPPPKPLYLTSEEQAKMRRQRRRADLQEKQAKQRAGLIEKDKPKVSRKNLMRVLGEEAVRDPTAVEARVNREIDERRRTHDEANAARALSKEQRLEKRAANQQADAARGIHMAVYRVDSLAYGQHRFKLDQTARQQALTGVLLYNPLFNLIIVEGGERSLAPYDKLMSHRITWTDIAAYAGEREPTRDVDRVIAATPWLQPLDADGELKDNSGNRCVKVWQGEVRQRAFKGWRVRVTNSDGEAREVLERAKLESMWALAKNVKK